MLDKRTDKQTQSTQIHKNKYALRSQHSQVDQHEHIIAALALLLGPETDYQMRVRATRRLARQGPSLLPLLVNTLSNYPEITTPSWPWWPPQYEHCSHLLVHLSQHAQTRLDSLLQYPSLSQPAGPVLWVSVIEAAGLLPSADYEPLLCQGLSKPWVTVRYAAAMALANLAGKVSLHPSTIEELSLCQNENEPVSIRMAASYALLRNNDKRGVEILMSLMHDDAPEEARKASVFVLATELPIGLSPAQRERLTNLLIQLLQDRNEEISLHAAHALSSVALPSTLLTLCTLLDSIDPHIQMAVLIALEEIAGRNTMRRVIHYQAVPAFVVPFLRSSNAELRRQASYTLAAFGGEYVAAVMGTTLLSKDHPGRIEAIESLRLLHGALRSPLRTNIVHWLLDALHDSQEEIQITAIDSLAYLIWQTHSRRQKTAKDEICHEILHDETAIQLLTHPSPLVRQRSVGLLSMLVTQSLVLRQQLLRLLHSDADSGVRACIAYTLGQIAAHWAIPELIRSLLDSDEHIVETVINALSNLALPQDKIVSYAIEELAWAYRTNEEETHHLFQAAQVFLRKWRRGC